METKIIILKRIIFSVLTLFVVSFIFYNSSLNADESTVQSVGMLELINNMFASLHLDIELSEYFVRKCAHFAEYFVLGTLLYHTVKSYIDKLWYKVLVSFGIGLVIACVDETIQLFSNGRSAQFSDVLLDFFGVCTAVIIFNYIDKCVTKKKKQKR